VLGSYMDTPITRFHWLSSAVSHTSVVRSGLQALRSDLQAQDSKEEGFAAHSPVVPGGSLSPQDPSSCPCRGSSFSGRRSGRGSFPCRRR
jgi:hypothetical protein